MKKKRRKYDSEYKEMIISLVKEGKNCAQVGREYGISRSMVSRWVKEYDNPDKPSFTGNGNQRLTEQEKKIKDLEKAYLDMKMERDILKKAADFFSKRDTKKNTNL
ncbi:transposase [Membranihabitans marinus]|uniref:transposase n=1 Tax=Membranihabitans marinus TaxID=1227546 RepID=UPI001F00B776|nr:transposase [Membranihabitans marinus]